MNKRQIKAKLKSLKFYDSTLTAKESVLNELMLATKNIEGTDLVDFEKLPKVLQKALRRFQVETEIVTKLFQAHILHSLPESYDILVNPKQIITKQEAEITITSLNTKEQGGIQKGGYFFIYLDASELKTYKEIYKELRL